MRAFFQKYRSYIYATFLVMSLVLAGVIGYMAARLPQRLSSCDFKVLDQYASPEVPAEVLKLFKTDTKGKGRSSP